MSLSNTKLSVIVPAYNKDSEVFESISSYVSQLKKLPYDWEIIVVDDASQDLTLREAIRSKRFNGNTHRIKIYSYDLNQGKGFALYYGFKKCLGDIVVFADADLDLPADNLKVLLSSFENNRVDIAIGSKRHPASKVNYPLERRLMSWTYQRLVKILFNLEISDTQVGLKAFQREVLEKSFPKIVVKKFAFDVELLLVAKLEGFTEIVEVPIVLNHNFSSTIHLNSIYRILIDTAAIFYRKNFLKYYDTPQYQFEKHGSVISSQKTYV